MSGKTKRRVQSILTIVTFAALLIFAFALRHQIADTISNLRKVNLLVLLLIIPLEILSYHASVKLYQGIFELLDVKLAYKYVYRVLLELNFVNTIFPSAGVSGFSYFSLRLKRHGVSAAKATLTQTMKLALIFTSFEIMLFIGLFLLALSGQANDVVILVAGSLTTLLIVGTFGVAYIIGSKRRIDSFFTVITKLINRLIHIVRPGNPETINIEDARVLFDEFHEQYLHIQKNIKHLLRPLLYAMLANVAEMGVIYVVYVAFGHWINPGAVIIAYALANFAGLLSILPGGVGIYEALMTGVMAAAGVSVALSLPVTIMYRILSMLMQLPIGYVFYHKVITSRVNQDIGSMPDDVHEIIKPLSHE